mmetsp:Transcript_25422/g.60099  ORF Transcript_25422/g.60099 Transcript_25422/m.60099 type:complete len:284 (+) Transcript_25422:680-1531(+)
MMGSMIPTTAFPVQLPKYVEAIDGFHPKNFHERAPRFASNMQHAIVRPNNVKTFRVLPYASLDAAIARHKIIALRNQSDPTFEMTLYAEIDGKPRTNIATLTQDRLISSEKTRPSTNVRYAGAKFTEGTSFSSMAHENDRHNTANNVTAWRTENDWTNDFHVPSTAVVCGASVKLNNRPSGSRYSRHRCCDPTVSWWNATLGSIFPPGGPQSLSQQVNSSSSGSSNPSISFWSWIICIRLPPSRTGQLPTIVSFFDSLQIWKMMFVTLSMTSATDPDVLLSTM